MRKTITIFFIFILNFLIAIDKDYPDFKSIIEKSNNSFIAQAQHYSTWQEILREDIREMENYDVKYYLIDIWLDFENEYIIADNLIRFEIVEDNVSMIFLHFTDNLTIDGIFKNDEELNYIHQENQIEIYLNEVYNSGEIIELNIQYSGYPDSRLEDGLKFESHSGTPIAFTMVSPKGARKWWPCKDTPADKPDSLDIWVTFPSEYICASNGLLIEEIDNGDNTVTNHWFESYPIATYLTSIAITNYELYSEVYDYNGSQMMIDNYVYPEMYDISVELFDITDDMIDFFSGIYGPYPFLDEKYGHAVCTNLGALAMEHQTCTSFQNSYITDEGAEYTVAHELAHQWAGDCLTIGSWAHVWLKEGFARYSEALWAENLFGLEALHDFMNNLDNGSPLDPCLYRDPEGSAGHIFNIVIYSKGAWTLHMLRGVLGDEDYFQTVYEFMQNPLFMYGNILTEDLENTAEAVSGMELDWFFDEWFFQEGRPRYEYTIYTSEPGNYPKLTILSQPFQEDTFDMYIPFEYNSNSDRFFVQGGLNYFTIPFVGDSYEIEFDPENWVLDYGYTEKLPILEEVNYRDGNIGIAWEEFFDPAIDGFNIYRKENNGEFELINNEPFTGTYYFDEYLNTESIYTYKIAAVFEQVYISKFSNEIEVTPINYTLDEGILLVDNTGDFINPPFPSDEDVDTFYHTLLEAYDFTDWDVLESGEPSLTEMARYSTIIWHNDDIMFTPLINNFYSIKNYLAAGGNLFLSTCRSLENIPDYDLEQFFGINSMEINNDDDFIGAVGQNSYPDISIDLNKIPMPTWDNALAYIYKFEPSENTDIIYLFDSYSNDPTWENRPCALKKTGDYKLILLGFPLYYMIEESAIELMNLTMQEFGEQSDVSDFFVPENNIILFNYPNPFTMSKVGRELVTTISFSVTQNAVSGSDGSPFVTLEIFNIKGQKVKTIPIVTPSPAHTLSVTWNGTDDSGKPVNSGVYLYKLRINNKIITRKMLLLK